MQTTKIQWTDMSWNPIRARRRDGGQRVAGHYCEKISSGCANCYASRMQRRFGMPAFPGIKGNDEVEPYLDEKALTGMLRSRKAKGNKVFVCDMTDLFGRWVPDEWIDRIFAVMALRPDVTFQLLTKRPERMAAECLNRNGHAVIAWHATRSGWVGRLLMPWPLPNVWLGTSVENQETADARIPHLLRCPAAVRFLSCEPLLDAVTLQTPGPYRQHVGRGYLENIRSPFGKREMIQRGIDWAIIGGESGPGARPCDVAWIRSLVQQFKAAGLPCFVKQLGSKPRAHVLGDDGFDWPPGTMLGGADEQVGSDGLCTFALRDKKGGDPSEWPADLRVREWPKVDRKKTQGHGRYEQG